MKDVTDYMQLDKEALFAGLEYWLKSGTTRYYVLGTLHNEERQLIKDSKYWTMACSFMEGPYGHVEIMFDRQQRN
jgi:hypothetical protein